MKYLVTGATGFIGRHLVNVLLSHGYDVNYLARKRSRYMDSRAAYFCWNPAEKPPLECMGRLDAVIHLAGEPIAQRWNPDVKRRIRDSRVLGTRNLVDAIRELKHKPAVLVSASGIGYYGNRGDEILTEDSSAATGFIPDLCKEWEGEAARARGFGLRVVPTRIAVVLGPGGALEKMAAPFRFGLGGRLGSGEQWLSWIHVNDLANLLHWVTLQAAIDGPLNASSPNPTRNAEFTRELGRVLHRPTLLPVPKFALRLALGELAEHTLESARVLPEVARQHGFQFSYPAISAALESLFDNTGALRPVLS